MFEIDDEGIAEIGLTLLTIECRLCFGGENFF
jgi:hypothetical protein